jgi:UDP-glucose 4-epimerase
VLDAAQRAGIRKVFFASSAAVYGTRPEHSPDTPWREDEILQPQSPYAISKLAGEQYTSLYQESGWVRTVCLRFFNVFGQGQRAEGAYPASIPTFCRLALTGLPLVIRGDGGQTRDFIHVRDVVRAIQHVTLNDETTGVLNAAFGMSVSIIDLAKKIIALSGTSSQICFVPAAPGDIHHSSANISKLHQSGFVPSVLLEDGLREILHGLSSRS